MGVEVTGIAQHRAWAAKLMPPVEEVAGGLWSIPVPIPDNPLRYVLVYALEAGDGLTLVDGGWDSEQSWQALTDGLGALGATPADVRTIRVTHMHPDHFGLVPRLRNVSGADVVMHPADAALLAGPAGTVADMLGDLGDFLRLSGMPETEITENACVSEGVAPFVAVDGPDRVVEDGDKIVVGNVRLDVIWTPGHTPGHICLLDVERGLLLAGDHLLPGISPNVSLYTTTPANPLADFLDSLEKLTWYDVGEILPAHEYRFTGLAHRVQALVEHHRDRLLEIQDILGQTPGATCWEIASALAWLRPWEQIRGYMRQAATGETMAHLALLVAQGMVCGDEGVPRRWFPANQAWRRAAGISSLVAQLTTFRTSGGLAVR